jgi:hypothetical protein
MMRKSAIDVISDNQFRKLTTCKGENGAILITRIWRLVANTEINTIALSLTELEEILKRHNGGEKTG